MQKPSWAEPLELGGVYYEGIVDDPSTVVEKLTADTVTTFGTRRSRQLVAPGQKFACIYIASEVSTCAQLQLA